MFEAGPSGNLFERENGCIGGIPLEQGDSDSGGRNYL